MKMCVRRLPTALLAVCAGFALANPALAIDTPETEANDSKAAANVVSAMAPGDSVSGLSTGASTTVAGLGSADYWNITTTAPGTPGWYRYRLVLTSSPAGHTATIRGLTQTDLGAGVGGSPTAGTDATAQTASTTSTPPRFVQWYANQTPSQIFYRVTGTTATTAGYIATLERADVPVTSIGSFLPGEITISTIAQGHGTDTDIQLFDASRTIIASNDDESVANGGTGGTLQSQLRRNLAPGTYYIAIGAYNTATSQAAVPDDDFRTGITLDFANAMCTDSTATNQNVAFRISDSATTVPVPSTRAGVFDINIYSFTVATPTTPIAVGTAAPNPVSQGQSTTLDLNVTAAPSSNLDNITSVTANVSALSGNPADTAVVFTRLSPGSSNWQYTVAAVNGTVGTQSVSYTIVDPISAGGNGGGAFSVTVSPPPATNDVCSTSTVISSVPFVGSVLSNTATNDIDVGCNSGANTETRFGVWYRYTTGADGGRLILGETGPNDVVISVFSGADCSSLTEIACFDAEANDLVNATANTTYWILVGMWSTTTLPTGAYQLTLDFVPVSGSCCVGTTCTITTQSACTGTFGGPGSNCGGTTGYALLTSTDAFEDISGGGTQLATVSACDDCGQTITLPFTFNYLGTDYTSVWVCSNGFIQFGGANNTTFGNVAIPAVGIPNNMLAVLWDDLNTTTGGDVFSRLDGSPGTQRFIISWQNVAQHAVTPVDANNFQIVLHEGNSSVEYRYGAVTPETTLNDYTIGYENAGGTAGASVPGASIGGGNTAIALSNANPCSGGGGDGACCAGNTCSVSSAAACTGTNRSFSGAGTVCNVFGTNNTTPCCFADYNQVGGVTVQDIFDFLSGYFTQNPLADINGGGITVQDIFDFLATYFTGCA